MIVRNALALSTLLTALVVGPGCATPGADVRLTPTANNATGHALSQRFEQAYAAVRPSGEMDVVLTTAPRAGDELRQVMHVRMLWTPMRGTKTDQPSTTNAVIDWGIFDPDGGADRLRYSGAGFVLAYRSGDELNVTIRNATMRLVNRRGQIDDPIGPATLAGKFTAVIDPARVDAALSALKNDAAGHATVDTH